MNRLLIILISICAGVIGYTLLHRHVVSSDSVVLLTAGQLQSATNELSGTQAAVATFQNQIQKKREALRQANTHPNITPELLQILESRDFHGTDRAWAQLREQLGAGWDASPDYVLVSKQAIKDVWYDKLENGHSAVAKSTVNLLELSPEETDAVNSALARARDGQWTHIESTPPAGEIVAQMRLMPPAPAFEAAQSNAFTGDSISILGPERAELFLPDAWRELRNSLAPTHPKTLTLRQTTTADGQPDLTWEVKEGGQVSQAPVRYANYPDFPLLELFPGGWQAMAKAMNFELPPAFFPPGYQPPQPSNQDKQ